MATWKKIIVSGSSISNLTNDVHLIYSNSADVNLSGSFSGSFVGDGSGLTGVTAAGTLSSSAQIASEISGAFAVASASFATDILALESFSSSLSSTPISYTGSFAGDGSGLSGITVDQNATVTASFSNAATASITHNFDSDNIIVVVYDDQDEQFIPQTIKAKTADVVEIHFTPNATGRAVVARGGHIVSGSIPFENIIAKPANLVSGSGQILVVTTGSGVISGSSQIAELGANILSSSAQIASDVSGSVTSLSSSIETRLVSIEGSVGAGGLLSSSAQIASDISGSFTSVSSSIAADIASNDADIAGLNTYTSSLKSAITVAGANVTVAGNLTVSGTTTTVDSTTVNIGDNIIALNGTGATKGGLAVNDGPASGSLLWDGTNDYWVAGPTGSETKIFTKGGNDGLLSGSAQIASNISGSVTSLSSSIESRLVSIEGSVGAGGLLSSSAQIASDISGSFTSVSASIASDIEQNLISIQTLDGKTLLSGSEQIAANISGSFTATSASIASDIATNVSDIADLVADSGSFSTRVTDLETFSASLDATFATEAEVNTATASLSSSIATDIAGLVVNSASFATDILALEADSGSFSTRVTDLELFSSSLDAGFVTEAELVAATASLSSSLAVDIASLDSTKADKTAISGAFTLTSSSLASRVTAQEEFSASLDATFATEAELNTATASLSSSIATDIAGLVANSASFATDILALETDSGSFSTRVTDLENFSASLDATFATEAEVNTATASLSSSLAADIAQNKSDLANLTSGELNSGSYNVTLDPTTGSLGFTDGLEIGDVYGQGSGTTDIRVPNGASWIELNYGDTDFIYLDGTDAGITLDNNYQWTFYGATGTFIAPGEIRTSGTISGSKFVLTGGELLSGSAQLNTITGVAAAISGSFTSVSASIAADIAGLGDEYATDVELNAATASLSASLAVDIAALEAFSSSVDTALNFSGTDVTVVGNLAVNGTGSFAYIEQITGSAKVIGDAFIVLNNNTPAERYAGVSVYDSGSAGTTGSFQFDGQSNDWFYEYTDAGQTDYGVALFGPEYNTKGSPTYLTNNTILKGTGGHHVAESNITDNGTTIGLGSDTSVTGNITVTGTVDGIDLQAASGSFSTRVTSLETSVGAGGLLSSSAQIASNISGAFADASSSIATEIDALQASVGSGGLLSSSAQIASDISGSFTDVSSSIATDIVSLDSSKADKTAVTGAFAAASGSFSTRVSDLEAFSSSLDAGFVTEAELLSATASLSSSLAGDIAQNATDIAFNLSEINALKGDNLISSSLLSSTGQGLVTLTNNSIAGAAVSVGLESTDTPTFAGLTVTGDLVVTGNTIEAQVTNLNIEDKYILLNSGSSTIGDSGIVFGGSSGVANSGAGLFWDASYNSNDGRLAIINAINAGSTGDSSPSYHIAGVFEGSELFAGLSKADHPGNIRLENGDIFIYV